jgi:hypothetical protein
MVNGLLQPNHRKQHDRLASFTQRRRFYPVQMARDMLIELVGGEPGAQLRDQFVSGKCA